MGSRCWHPQYRFFWVFSRTVSHKFKKMQFGASLFCNLGLR
jgi:hypothetical protein